MRFSQPASARQINRLRTLNLISRNAGISRADVSRELGLNKVSTSEIVDQLVAEGMVAETGKRQTAAGRRPIGLELQKDRRTVLAVDAGTRNTAVALVNLGGDMLRFERFPTGRTPSPEQMSAMIIKTANKFLSRMKDPGSVCALAVSLNAAVEPATGTVLSAPQWGWESVPLSHALARHLPFPAVVENNVKAMVLGERWFSDLPEDQTLFYVNWGEHIGAAWVSEGKILSQDCQFGHLSVASKGLCRCGAIGCLETAAAGWSLTEQTGSRMTVKQLCAAAETDRDADRLLTSACEAMAGALISVAAILRPQKILIGGGISALPEKYFTVLTDTFARKAPVLVSRATKVERAALGERAGILGTAVVALDEFVFRRTLLEQLKHHGT